MLKVWISGANGHLGQALCTRLDREKYQLIATDVAEVDVTVAAEVRAFADANRPDVIINCTGFNDEDGCETDSDRAYRVNALAPRNLALAADALVSADVDAVFTPTDNTIMKAELTIYETFANAGIPHYTGADSFALNGAFLGYGVDYANLGVQTADMVAEILLDGKEPATLAVKTFDNGTATVNTEICAALGYDYDEIASVFAPFCTKVQSIVTAESFDDLQ